MNAQTILKRGTFWELFKLMVRQRHVRRKTLGIIEARTYKAFVEDNPDNLPRHVQESKYEHLVALLHGFDRAVEHGLISKHVINRLLDVFLKNIILGGEEVKKAADSLGFNPPMFLLVSPTGRCNLRCKGCYAESDPGNHASLDFDTFDRILTEKRELWGSHFTVISGGEPFLWRDHGRDLLDMVEKHDTDFFMVYTNSTLITEEVAARMAELGNITPAISVEGFEKETDARRGRGVYRKILTAFENLRTHGVPFGVSTTPTTNNWEVITSERFVDFYFEREGALYGWLFQYMPIGRGQSLELMVKPEERVQMLKRMRQQVRERKVLLADFWNSGPVSNGCISAGRPGGYFYIDWNGDMTPCAFVPYAADNIYDIFARGENINAAFNTPFFKRIRAWQDEYGYAQPPEKIQNWLCPCVIRDHFDVFQKALALSEARPINEEAAIAIKDSDYCNGMVQYGKELRNLTDPIWTEEMIETEQVENPK